MTTRAIKRLNNGAFAVRVQVSADVMRFAQHAARRGGYFGPADYLNAILNTAMLEAMENEPLSPREIEARRKAAEQNEDGLPI